ncbi:N-acetyltransferase [Rhizocola hellebori]|uniref:N-acetyltransferase n=1 Tax=Rhizocola hellebori TaxID=1392758 RepID=A0A8J3Q7G3_9ACTN|nr:N-acetyltransferase [Rhizocola hellebori]GIH04673.1 N-acetyltransferase [Rhizocola hellebori]
MLIRRETPADIPAIYAVTKAAFSKPDQPAPVEAELVDWLRADEGWIPALSLVAVTGEDVVGHVVCTRAWITPSAAPSIPAAVAGAGSGAADRGERGLVSESTALGLGPLSVHPDHQRRGVGLALMHSILGAADALGESLVALLGNPGYYTRFGFGPASGLGIAAPDPQWGNAFQARPLSSYDGTQSGTFRYSEPFSRI